MKKMKKLLAAMLTTTMVFSMSGMAMAADQSYISLPNTGADTASINKYYKATGSNMTAVLPEETFYLVQESKSVEQAGTDQNGKQVTNETMPDLVKLSETVQGVEDRIVGSVTLGNNSGDAAHDDTAIGQFDVKLPMYTAVGVYKYVLKEVAGDTAGLTYYGKKLQLVVTVTNGEAGKLVRNVAVHTEEGFSGTKENGLKTDHITNEYAAGELSVKKTVTGNLGDKKKEFKVTVVLTAPENKVVKSMIGYQDGGEVKEIAPETWVNTNGVIIKTIEINLKHDETITFYNIPHGVEYQVIENDYVSEGYNAPVYSIDSVDVKGKCVGNIDKNETAVEIVNEKTSEIDTGIFLDNMPYILLLALVAGVAILFVTKRRNRFED